VRVRITDDKKARLTVKGPPKGISRDEFEYDIPVEDARKMLDFCGGHVVEKNRYIEQVGDHTWEVDEFLGRNKGLWLAEIELSDEDEPFERPDWAVREVSEDKKYKNSYLARHPFETWDAGSKPGNKP
jgi:adenylate cyclase